MKECNIDIIDQQFFGRPTHDVTSQVADQRPRSTNLQAWFTFNLLLTLLPNFTRSLIHQHGSWWPPTCASRSSCLLRKFCPTDHLALRLQPHGIPDCVILIVFQVLALLYYVSNSYNTTSIPISFTSGGQASSDESAGTPQSNANKDLGTSPLLTQPGSAQWEDLASTAPGPRMNATFVTLARNSDVWDIARSIRQVEDRFNRRYNYDWVFLNDKPFDATFKAVTSSLVSGKTHYGEIPEEHWSFPPHIDQERAKKVREEMRQKQIIYGDSISYRHMCRFESGFFFRQPLMMNYEYYWRVEPSVELFCDVHYDPFRLMHEGDKKYSFVLSLYEYVETIPTLWESVRKFIKNHPEHIAKDNSLGFLSDDNGETYNHCHFVSVFFRITDLCSMR